MTLMDIRRMKMQTMSHQVRTVNTMVRFLLFSEEKEEESLTELQTTGRNMVTDTDGYLWLLC